MQSALRTPQRLVLEPPGNPNVLLKLSGWGCILAYLKDSVPCSCKTSFLWVMGHQFSKNSVGFKELPGS